MHFLKIPALILVILAMACNTQDSAAKEKASNEVATIAKINADYELSKQQPLPSLGETASLDGRTFRLSEPGPTGMVETDEYLYFKDGFFETSKTAQLGFQKAQYICGKMGDAFSFKATLINADKTEMIWEGMITHQTNMLTSFWIKKNEMPEAKSYKAEEVKK
jgi:hypothetical protein